MVCTRFREGNGTLAAGRKLRCAIAYGSIADSYREGQGVERDMAKSKYNAELAAMGGHVIARHNLGCKEGNVGNTSRAVKHWMISAAAGDDDSLTGIRECFQNGHATKDDFEKALRAHKDAKDAMKSEQRDAAATDKSFSRLRR